MIDRLIVCPKTFECEQTGKELPWSIMPITRFSWLNSKMYRNVLTTDGSHWWQMYLYIFPLKVIYGLDIILRLMCSKLFSYIYMKIAYYTLIGKLSGMSLWWKNFNYIFCVFYLYVPPFLYILSLYDSSKSWCTNTNLKVSSTYALNIHIIY